MDTLKEYVKLQRNAGFSDDAIKTALEEAGYDTDEISKSFKQSHWDHKTGAIIIGVATTVAVAALLFFLFY